MSNFTPEQIQEILDLYYENTAHRQYIGARYVPIFGRKGETSIEWDNSAPYEPLTIVLHEGNSYTSRQFVPTGVAITNELYWANTGNYNAQVEQYRQDVEQLSSSVGTLSNMLPSTDFDSVNTVKKAIDDAKTYTDEKAGTGYVGNYGAKENDATLDWQSIIDAVAAVSTTIDFGSGTWIINEEITFPEGLQAVTGNGATINVTENVETLFDFSQASLPGSGKRFFRLSNLVFNCNGNVDTCIYSESPNVLNISDCAIRDVREYGIRCTVLGSFVNNCYFTNADENCHGQGTAVSTGTDSFISNCKAFYFNTFFEVGNTSVITGNYVFAIYSHANTPAIGVKGNSATTNCISINNNEFDCIQYICVDISNATVNNNVFYWNNNDDSYTGSKALFVLDQMADFRALTFSDNSLGFSNNLSGNYYTFLALNSNNGNAVGYVSANNKTYPYAASGNIGNWSHIHFTIGFYDNSNVKLNKTDDAVYTRGITSPSVTASAEPKQFAFYSHINETVYANHNRGKVVSLLNNNTASLVNDMYVGATVETFNAPVYVANLITALYKIVIDGGAAFNMDWVPFTSTPSEGTRYQADVLSA